MNKILLLVTLCFLTFFSEAQIQDWAWATSGSGAGDESAGHITIDASGNLIVTGRFNSTTATLSSITLTNSGVAGTNEVLVAKYNASGVIQWAKRAQGSADDEGIAVTTDPTGNIYVAGNYESPTITFGTITLTNSASGFTDIFVVKYDPAGNVLWAKTYGGNLLESVASIKADNSGNTYITGTFNSISVLFGSYGVVNAGNSDAFLAKIDVNGVAQWAKQVGGSQNDNGLSITHDGSGNIFVLGQFNSSNLTTYNLNNAGVFDMFIGKYDAVGNFVASKAIGGTMNETGYYMVTDASGNLYISASFDSPTLNLGSVTLSNGSTRDMLLMKLNSGLTTQWAKKVNGNLTSNPTGLFIDATNSLFMTGTFNVTSLNFGTIVINNGSSSEDGFIVKYDLSGNDLWGKGTSASGDQKSNGVVVDNLGSIYIAGSYDPSLVLGSSTLTAGGGEEMYLAKLCVVPGTPTMVSNVTVCSKKTGTLTVQTPSGILANWYSAASGGSLLLAGSNSFTAASTGTFYAESFNAATGCSNPSRIAVSLSVQPGASVTVSGKTLTATSGSAFKWIECVKDSVLTGQTSQNYTVTQSGNYAVIVTNNGCIDTSACKFYSINVVTGTVTVPNDTVVDPPDPVDTTVVTTGLSKHQRYLKLTIYPNPNDGNFTIKSDIAGTFYLINLLGQTVRTLIFVKDEETRVLIKDLESGVYFLTSDTGRYRQRVIVTR